MRPAILFRSAVLATGLSLALALGGRLEARAWGFSAEAQSVATPAEVGPSGAEQALRSHLELSLKAFNRGDFDGYLHDLSPQVTYNGIQVERARLVEINRELKRSFGDLRMRYRAVTVSEMGDGEANVTTVAEFTGTTANYDGSGLPATYSEVGEVTAMYRRAADGWRADTLQVAWNDSFIDIGQPFGVMGFTSLPVLLSAKQPYKLRMYFGDDSMSGARTEYAYSLVPLATVISKTGAEDVYRSLRFTLVPKRGLNVNRAAPSAPGTYTHVLVVPKLWRRGGQESLLGHKIYTRLVQVE
ncbi:MAG: hypothetical protein VKP62_15050 [Candidatus Sericytochromatia bacterium]|nr:hypothetical protein [Candidatus Sericytochromatia bacterium]